VLDFSLDSRGKKSGWAGRAGIVSVTPEVRLIAGPAAATAAPQNDRESTVRAARLSRSVNPGLDRELGIVQCKYHGYRSPIVTSHPSMSLVSLPDTFLPPAGDGSKSIRQ